MAKRKVSAEITVSMSIDVDGAANAYGPDDSKALDNEINAHSGSPPKRSNPIVGYLTENDNGRTPIVQGRDDPFPGFYISTTAYADKTNSTKTDPRRYVNAAEINYTLHARAARQAGVTLGDLCVVHSLRTNRSVYAIVGDSGNSSGAEGSLALLQRLGYRVINGKSGGEDDRKILVRYFAGTNPKQKFFLHQAELDAAAANLNLDTDFSELHPGDPGTLVFDKVSTTDGAKAARVLPFAPLDHDEEPPVYPGHLIKVNIEDRASVELIQQRLRDLGYTRSGTDARPLEVDGQFGADTLGAVELFQARHTDLLGQPLKVDGVAGSDTWGALFGRAAIHTSPVEPKSSLLRKVLDVAGREIGVREDPPGSNRGKKVEEYQASVGVDPGEPWCAAFVYWCFARAASDLDLANPMKEKKCRTGSVVELWNHANANGAKIVTHDAALADPSRIMPGMVFVITMTGGHGHTGLVSRVIGNSLETIEGNTNDDGSREGIGVFRRIGRGIASINRGFIGFT
jgi:peptidoglycan hydrolase-like protein with peptidoglycan-binding domain